MCIRDSNNVVLPILLSSSKEISDQLNLLSNINSERQGLLTLSTYGKNEVAFTYIRKSNSFDTISENDTLKNKYQKSELFFQKINDKELFKVIIDEYMVSSNKDIILENIIRDFNSSKNNVDSEFKKIIKTSDLGEPFNIYSKSDNLGKLDNKLVDISFFPDSKTSWVGYDFNYSIKDIYLSGITRITDSINGKINILMNLPPSKIKTDKILSLIHI